MNDFDLIIGHRDRGNDWCRAANLEASLGWWRWHGIDPIVVDDGRSGDDQWNRSAAYNRGAEISRAGVLAYVEADLLIPGRQILEAIKLAAEHPVLVIAFSRFLAMTDHDSRMVRAGRLHPSKASAEQVRGDNESIGAANILSRESLEMIGQFDESFEGHAYDDDATEMAFRICCGPTRFIEGPGWHQFHHPGALYATPESTEADLAATERNRQRYELYRRAQTPEDIRNLTKGNL